MVLHSPLGVDLRRKLGCAVLFMPWPRDNFPLGDSDHLRYAAVYLATVEVLYADDYGTGTGHAEAEGAEFE